MIKRSLSLSFLVLVFLAARPAEACDYCILSQGISPLETVKGAGIRVNERYTLLNSLYNGTHEVDNRSAKGLSAKEEYWTTEITGFYSVTQDATLLARKLRVARRQGRTIRSWRCCRDGTLHFLQDAHY
ncbi:MAG: hypothetical protein HY039_00020 [Nitrospirae bacterium]|nr:hypothetical protein [Nitrospirota bacterium]